ncbi:MAG: hypothetical protein PUB19_09475 [Lachnospiraceae bacterium]|nr:hypothetical protein [Lachnospiraceae bacterium]
MINPGTMMKIMNAKKTFTDNHPKFVKFLQVVFSSKVEEGTVFEITVTKPGQEPLTTNFKVLQSDLDLMDSLKDLQ